MIQTNLNVERHIREKKLSTHVSYTYIWVHQIYYGETQNIQFNKSSRATKNIDITTLPSVIISTCHQHTCHKAVKLVSSDLLDGSTKFNVNRNVDPVRYCMSWCCTGSVSLYMTKVICYMYKLSKVNICVLYLLLVFDVVQQHTEIRHLQSNT